MEFLRFIHVTAWTGGLFHRICIPLLRAVFPCIGCTQCVYPFSCWWNVGCFQPSAIINKAAANVLYKPLHGCMSLLLQDQLLWSERSPGVWVLVGDGGRVLSRSTRRAADTTFPLGPWLSRWSDLHEYSWCPYCARTVTYSDRVSALEMLNSLWEDTL